MELLKKTNLIIVLNFFMIFAILGCDNENLGFDISTTSSSTIEKMDFCPPDIGIDPPDILLESIEKPIQEAMSQIGPAIQSEIEKQNTGPISHVYLQKLSIKMTSPPKESDRKKDNTLGFISKIEIYIKQNNKDKEELLAESENIDSTATIINFRTQKVDLNPYIEKGFETEVKVTARYCPGVDIPIKVNTTTRVTF